MSHIIMERIHMHPANEIKGIHGNLLKGKHIALAITGSIAATECIKLARELLRNGADVLPILTESATTIIHPDSMEFSTGHKPITKLTGATEHVTYCGMNAEPVDLLLISPATANTISKIACGIDDTTVTTFATTAIGSNIPISIVPAMHLSMYTHPIVQENISKLQGLGIEFLEPDLTATKAKMPTIDDIVSHTIRRIGTGTLNRKKILVIAGATEEHIDDIRIITNKSSGRMGISLAKEAYLLGADVTLYCGRHTLELPKNIDIKPFSTHNDLKHLIIDENEKYDIVINCAAIADYTPLPHDGKIPSGRKELTIKLKPTEKLLLVLRKKHPKSTLIGFKAESEEHQLLDSGSGLIQKNNLDYCCCNTCDAFDAEESTIIILGRGKKEKRYQGDKKTLARCILKTITQD